MVTKCKLGVPVYVMHVHLLKETRFHANLSILILLLPATTSSPIYMYCIVYNQALKLVLVQDITSLTGHP